MAEANSIAPRCCGVVGLFTSPRPTGKRGGARQGSGGCRPGAGRKPSAETLFKRAFVGPPVPKSCATCGANFYGRGRNCEPCKQRGRTKNGKSARACDHEKPFFKNGRQRKVCYECAPKKSVGRDRVSNRKLSIRISACAECGRRCEMWSLKKYCSESCKRAASSKRLSMVWIAKRDRANSSREVRACVVCGSEFRVGLRTLCCSEMCSAQLERDRRSGHTHKRRADRFGCSYEHVDRIRVFERDKWRCQICGVKVDRQSAELDHIVPMSMGGAHSYANAQCACATCNRKKGAKPFGQLHLGIAA